ncbi:MAG: AMP-binding protein [Myxococcota bacterium]
MAGTSYGSMLSRLASEDPDRVAIVCDDQPVTRDELERKANRLAHDFAERGVGIGDRVSLVLPNGLPLITAMFACWKLGAVPNPLSDRMPEAELAEVLARAEPRLVMGGTLPAADGGSPLPAAHEPDSRFSDAPLPERISPHERALASGGSTGLPKLIIPSAKAFYDPETASPFFRPRRCALVPGPVHHAAPFSACFQAVFSGATVILMSRFDASQFLELVELHRVDRVTLVPTMMLRILRLPEKERLGRDVSSLEFVISGGAPMPPWLMRQWIEWLGPDVMHEVFGPSERIGGTHITGREWLEHPGSVGRPIGGARIRIKDDQGRLLLPGEDGEIWMLPEGGPGSTYHYVGGQAQVDAEGWESVGDMGHLDEDGYLYLADRKSDMILCGGRNVYPAEVEAAIEAHPEVQSSAVIGLPDEDLGQRIHAIVEVTGPLTLDELRSWLDDRLVRYKHPATLECVNHRLRDDAGKSRRARLREERVDPFDPPDDMGPKTSLDK